MREKSCMTRNLIFLFIGLLLIYMLQKNGNFFPVFFLISSLFLIYRNRKEKRKVDKIDVLIGILLAILSLNPIYAICIGLGYVGAKQVFDNSLYLIEAVGYLRQLGREQRLLGGKYLQISGVAMFHQQLRASDCGFQ